MLPDASCGWTLPSAGCPVAAGVMPLMLHHCVECCSVMATASHDNPGAIAADIAGTALCTVTVLVGEKQPTIYNFVPCEFAALRLKKNGERHCVYARKASCAQPVDLTCKYYQPSLIPLLQFFTMEISCFDSYSAVACLTDSFSIPR